MELTVKRHGQRTEAALRCYDVTRTPAAWRSGRDVTGRGVPRASGVVGRRRAGRQRRRAGSVRPVATRVDVARCARGEKKTIAMLFESPNAKLFPAFNIPPPVRLR
ncbi:unnamed protein product [Arctia plantaginis]|uniref:Uncharacterized protein n=1 Tax=Arctia plantaginis TaxID=874455 RepID=A0A8S1AFM2_ARCPL|nr:unnamed protein product [Arctia plantaginis]